MIEFNNGGRLVQDLNELPNLQNAENLFCDFETTSFDSKVEALRPHHGHRIAGICITADEHQGAWYVPIRCTWKNWNLPVDPVLSWLKDTVGSCKNWVNHNVKFDAHFARYDNVDFNGRLVDTIVLSKLINSDRFNYGLKPLSQDWLEYDTGPAEDRVKAWLDGAKSKNYGDCPADIMGEYGCQDVITNRILYKYVCRRKSERLNKVWETEIKLTPVLFDMEVEGMRVDPQQLQIKELILLNQMIKLEESLHKDLGFVIRPHTNADCYEALCNQFGLPVLGWTDGGKDKKPQPSFDKDTLVSYLAHPIVKNSEKMTRVVQKIAEYRKRNTLLTYFIKPYQEHEVDGVMHPDYNQIVRTGRMSCRQPNAQQLSPEAKELVIPKEKKKFVSFDYSQIEFRLIVHYIKAQDAIEAYNKNADTDFHTWVAEMCGIKRKPAKNINFMIAFGGGKKKVISMLSSNMDIVGDLSNVIDKLIEEGKFKEEQRQNLFDVFREKKGEKVYNEYHQTLPTLKSTTYRASNSLKARGFVFNAYGRERRLPEIAAFRAFNTIVQSCAADIMKERTVAVAPRYNSYVRDLGIGIIASVHDETLFEFPEGISHDVGILRDIRDTLEDTEVKFRVPIRISCGCSDKNWRIAGGDDGEVDLRFDKLTFKKDLNDGNA